MSLSEDLRAVWALIDTPEKWTKGAYARDANGQSVPSISGFAVCFCIIGANDRYGQNGFNIDNAVREKIPPAFQYLSDYNDHPDTTHADMKALFDRAIAEAEQ